MRDETERVELVELGWNRLLPPLDTNQITAGILAAYVSPSKTQVPPNLYGGGMATIHILKLLTES